MKAADLKKLSSEPIESSKVGAVLPASWIEVCMNALPFLQE